MTNDEATTHSVMKLTIKSRMRDIKANEALKKMAENARELGLDYEPDGVHHNKPTQPIIKSYLEKDNSAQSATYTCGVCGVSMQMEQPAQQEPFCWCIESVNSADWCFAATKKGVVINSLLMDEQCVKSEPFALYTSPSAQRQARSADTWIGLTDGERKDIERQSVYVEGAIRLTEAKLKEKNT